MQIIQMVKIAQTAQKRIEQGRQQRIRSGAIKNYTTGKLQLKFYLLGLSLCFCIFLSLYSNMALAALPLDAASSHPPQAQSQSKSQIQAQSKSKSQIPSHSAQSAQSVQSTQPQALNHFNAEGKISFTNGKKGGHGTIFWQQQGPKYSIKLIGALGSGTLEIYGRPGFVGMVQSNGETHSATNAEQLIQKVLGWNIPVSPLRYWLQGQPVPGSKPQDIQFNSAGQLSYLRQQGWQIHYEKYTEQQGRLLPSRIILKHGSIQLKFLFPKWSIF